jgi:NADH-quinone oxidoreductase subunit M
MLKMGGYGLLRIALPFAPSAFVAARGLIAALGIIGIVYGAAMAYVQTDLKRLVAYSSVSHMGFVLLAISIGTPAALGAAVLVMVSHGFVAGLAFFLVGALYERTHTRELGRLGGLGAVVPLWATAFVFVALASAGLPALSGFPGEFVTMVESFSAFGWWTAIAAIGLVLGAAYNLRAVRRSVQGPIGEFDSIPDLGARELSVVALFSAGIVYIGVQPHVVIQGASAVLTALARIVNGGA